MSRLGKLPIVLPTGVTAELKSNLVLIKGPKGGLEVSIPSVINVKLEDNSLLVNPENENDKDNKSKWGLIWSLLSNAILGVTEGFVKKLEIQGVGYRAALSGDTLNLKLGFSHQIDYKLPQGISAVVEGNIITLSGIDKQLLGETAAQIRRFKKPESYKGKGIRYVDEQVRRKAGKAAAKEK